MRCITCTAVVVIGFLFIHQVVLAALANTTLQAESYATGSGVTRGATSISSLNNNDWVRFTNVDFTNLGINRIGIRVGSTQTGRTIEVRLGSNTGTLIGTLAVQPTGRNTTFVEQVVPVTPGITGNQSVVLVFKTSSTASIGNVDSFRFFNASSTGTTTSTSTPPSTTRIDLAGTSTYYALPGGTATITLNWYRMPMGINLLQFMHFDQNGSVAASVDDHMTTSATWTNGLFSEQRVVRAPSTLGTYEIRVGLSGGNPWTDYALVMGTGVTDTPTNSHRYKVANLIVTNSIPTTSTSTPPPPPVPTATLTVNGTSSVTIATTSSVVIAWSSTNATSCSLTPFGWSGTSNAGSSTPFLSATTTVSLTCTGSGGSVTRTVTIKYSPTIVTPPPPQPTASVTVNGSSVATLTGTSSVTVAWNSTNANSCTVMPFNWSGISSIGSTSPLLSSTTTVTLTCVGAGGIASSTARVLIIQPTPTSTPAEWNAYSWIPADLYSGMNGVIVENEVGGNNVSSWDSGDWIRYDNVYFGPNTTNPYATGMIASVGVQNVNANNTIEVRLDSLTGPIVANLNMEGTGATASAYLNYVDQSASTSQHIQGYHNVYLIARGTNGVGHVGDMLRFRFTYTPTSTVSTGSTTITGALTENDFIVNEYATGLNVPWGLDFLPDGRMIVAERIGTISLYTATNTRTIVGTVTSGYPHGIVLDPNFSSNGYVYLYVGETAGNRVVRYTLSGNSLGGETTILSGLPANHPHNGGRLRFGPDGKLYVTVGDGTFETSVPPNTALSASSLAGKILRINKDGTIPSDNPYGNAVWTMGHRNPQGITWDSSGKMFAAEHGDVSLDEVNSITRGSSYGWPLSECTNPQAGYTQPIWCWFQSPSYAPSGLDFYYGNLYVAGLRGNQLRRIVLSPTSSVALDQGLFASYGRLREVKYHNGALYVTTSNNTADENGNGTADKILKIQLKNPPTSPTSTPGATLTVNGASAVTLTGTSSVTVAWSTSNVSNCTLSPFGWSGTSHTGSSSPLLATTTSLTLSCVGVSGVVTSSAIVTILKPSSTTTPTTTVPSTTRVDLAGATTYFALPGGQVSINLNWYRRPMALDLLQFMHFDRNGSVAASVDDHWTTSSTWASGLFSEVRTVTAPTTLGTYDIRVGLSGGNPWTDYALVVGTGVTDTPTNSHRYKVGTLVVTNTLP